MGLVKEGRKNAFCTVPTTKLSPFNLFIPWNFLWLKKKLKNMINLVVWIWQYQESETNNTANLDVRNKKNITFSDSLHCQKTKALLPSANSIFSSSRLNIFFGTQTPFLYLYLSVPTNWRVRKSSHLQIINLKRLPSKKILGPKLFFCSSFTIYLLFLHNYFWNGDNLNWINMYFLLNQLVLYNLCVYMPRHIHRKKLV